MAILVGRATQIARPTVGLAHKRIPSRGMPNAAPSSGDHWTASAARAADALVITTAGASDLRVAAHTKAPLARAANITAATGRANHVSGATASAAVRG